MTTTKLCPDCTNGWIVQTGGEESVKVICPTCNYAGLPEAELQAHLAAVVSVECGSCRGTGTRGHNDPCDYCQGLGRRWLLRKPCWRLHLHRDHQGVGEPTGPGGKRGECRWCQFRCLPLIESCPKDPECHECKGASYVYSGDYDGLRAAIEALGLILDTEQWTTGDYIAIYPEKSRKSSRDGCPVAEVKVAEGITGLRAIQAALARAVDAMEEQDA